MDLIERLRAMRVNGVDEDSQPKPKVLEEINLAGIVKHIQKLLASDNRKKYIFNIIVTLGTYKSGCYTEVILLYSQVSM